jgi:GNAT superfamily N-acetyltransferase
MARNHTIKEIIDNSLYNLSVQVAQSNTFPAQVTPELTWMLTPQHAFWPRSIARVCASESEIEAQVETITARIQAGELPANWYVGPKSTPPNQGDYLLQHGFTQAARFSGMSLELDAVDESVVGATELEIKPVSAESDLLDWARVITVGAFNRAAAQADGFYDVMKPLLACSNARFYLGFYQGIPVATSMLFLSGGAVGVYFVVTHPDHRKKGYGTALTLAVLRDGRRLGYQTSVLQATSMGEPIYRQLGFREDCHFDVFVLRP